MGSLIGKSSGGASGGHGSNQTRVSGAHGSRIKKTTEFTATESTLAKSVSAKQEWHEYIELGDHDDHRKKRSDDEESQEHILRPPKSKK